MRSTDRRQMLGEHEYSVEVDWTGNLGGGTSGYRAYSRKHVVTAAGKEHSISGSSDRTFHGDRERWNPEELLLAALSQCHMLSYLHVAVSNGLIVVGYNDRASGVMVEDGKGGGAFTEVTLHPVVEIANPEEKNLAMELHHEAAGKCFIAASVAFPVRHRPEVVCKS